jgi:glycine cleavage system aminomethyltransferase T
VLAAVLRVPIELVQRIDIDDLNGGPWPADGGVAAHRPLRTARRTWRLSAPAGAAGPLTSALQVAAVEHEPWAVTVTSRQEDDARVRVCGPAAAELLGALSVEVVAGRRVAARIGELSGHILAWAPDDIEVQVRADAGRALWAALLVAGEPLGARPVGLEALERWRPWP